MNRYVLCLLFMAFGWQTSVKGQTPSNPTPDLASHVAEYFSDVSDYAIIYTGKEEIKYPAYMINHPYLYTSEYKKANLSFDGVLYPNVKLRLNLHLEELVVQSEDGRFNVVVPTDCVDFATMDGNYIFYNVPQTGIKQFSKGYYVRFHNGKYPVYKRETCFIQSVIKDMKIEASFVRKNRLYVYKDDVYHMVGSKRAVLKLFSTKKRELKRFIKEQGLNYKKTPDEFVKRVTLYYETLTP